MHTAYGHVDGVLYHSVVALYSYKVALEVIIDLGIVKS